MAAVGGLAVLGFAVAPGLPLSSDTLSDQQLRAALLDPVDFPEGWASDSERSARQRGFGVPKPTEDSCGQLFDSEEDTTAKAGFARTRSGPFVTTVLASHEDPEEARGEFAQFRAQAQKCRTIHTREGPRGSARPVAYQASGLDVKKLGEESTAVRFERRGEAGAHTGEVVAEVVIARVGAHLVRVAQAGREDGATEDVESIADRAVDKLEQVCDGHMPTPSPNQPGTTDL
ncbi:hypothetical protein D7294_04095 [Streptomyces hoynatensis]|uniref:Sensor domain-containing protein n=2 Tax=Streptomyces hoynatensis TaxID=1141874 RepID=A0A3A9ZBJ5_9ACTN|nr:hypothetical protein D7294_04095 [Streptomyces hoynatensis]